MLNKDLKMSVKIPFVAKLMASCTLFHHRMSIEFSVKQSVTF